MAAVYAGASREPTFCAAAAEVGDRERDRTADEHEDDEVVRDGDDLSVGVRLAQAFDAAPRAVLHLTQRLAAGHARVAAVARHPLLQEVRVAVAQLDAREML